VPSLPQVPPHVIENNNASAQEKELIMPLPRPLSNEALAKIRADAQAKAEPSTVRSFPAPYTNEELALLRAAAIRKGSPLDDKETAAALGRKYVAPDPLGLRRLPGYVEVQ
jgi:hypothetical protein